MKKIPPRSAYGASPSRGRRQQPGHHAHHAGFPGTGGPEQRRRPLWRDKINRQGRPARKLVSQGKLNHGRCPTAARARRPAHSAAPSPTSANPIETRASFAAGTPRRFVKRW